MLTVTWELRRVVFFLSSLFLFYTKIIPWAGSNNRMLVAVVHERERTMREEMREDAATLTGAR